LRLRFNTLLAKRRKSLTSLLPSPRFKLQAIAPFSIGNFVSRDTDTGFEAIFTIGGLFIGAGLVLVEVIIVAVKAWRNIGHNNIGTNAQGFFSTNGIDRWLAGQWLQQYSPWASSNEAGQSS